MFQIKVIFTDAHQIVWIQLHIVYYILENRGASEPQKKKKKEFATRQLGQLGAPLEYSQTSAVGPFLQI